MEKGERPSPDPSSRLARVLVHMPTSDDLTLIVLKAHLLLEENLRDLVLAKMPCGEAIDHADFKYWQLTHIAWALRDDPKDHWIWDSCLRLNALRNNLAHHLESEKLDAQVKDLIEAIDSCAPAAADFFTNANTRADGLRSRLCFLIGRIQSLIRGE